MWVIDYLEVINLSKKLVILAVFWWNWLYCLFLVV